MELCVPLILGPAPPAPPGKLQPIDDFESDVDCLFHLAKHVAALFDEPEPAPFPAHLPPGETHAASGTAPPRGHKRSNSLSNHAQPTPPPSAMRTPLKMDSADRRKRALSMSTGEGVFDAETKFASMHVVPVKNSHIARRKYKNKKGKTVIKGTESYDLMLALKMGIRTGVEICHEQRRNRVDLGDFALRNVEYFPAQGSVSKPRHNSRDFNFKDYCPFVFRQLREYCGVDTDEYIDSICDDHETLRELGSPGRSGAVFYFSHDMKYLIKSVSKKATQHTTQTNARRLLQRTLNPNLA